MLPIYKIKSNEIGLALSLVWEVFKEFEAPDYTDEGVNNFKKDIVDSEEFAHRCMRGAVTLYGAYDEGRLVGVAGVTENQSHINLLFVRKEYQNRGIGKALFRYVLDKVVQERPEISAITVNASPYAVDFYIHIGFIALTEEQTCNGMRFTPMGYPVA